MLCRRATAADSGIERAEASSAHDRTRRRFDRVAFARGAGALQPLQEVAGVLDQGLVVVLRLRPLAELPGQAHRRASVQPRRGAHANQRAAADAATGAGQRGHQRLVLQKLDRRHAPDPAIGAQRDRQAGAEMLMMAGPAIDRVGIDQIAQPDAQQRVRFIQAFQPQRMRRQGRARIGQDAPADHVCAAGDLEQVAGEPVGGHAGVAVGAGDHPVGAARRTQALARGVHQLAAREADVRLPRRQAHLHHMQPKPGLAQRERPCKRCRVVGAVVRQQQDLEAACIQRQPVQTGLRSQ